MFSGTAISLKYTLLLRVLINKKIYIISAERKNGANGEQIRQFSHFCLMSGRETTFRDVRKTPWERERAEITSVVGKRHRRY